MNFRYILFGFMALWLTACTTAPPYQEPPVVALGRWSFNADVTPHATSLDRWWECFADPTLNQLVASGTANNRDVRLAVLRIDAANAQLAVVSGGRWPVLTANAKVNRFRQSENTQSSIGVPAGALGNPAPLTITPDIKRNDTLYSLGLGASWEPDFFGRVRAQIDAATAYSEMAKEDSDAVRMLVTAEIVRAYLALRDAQAESRIQQQLITTFAQTRDLIVRRIAAGDLANTQRFAAEAQLAQAQTQLAPVEAHAKAYALALGTLTGGLPEDQLALLDKQTDIVLILPDIPVGERSDLLRRRPDIRAAERKLAGVSAEVDIAIAEQFPHFAITASGGFESLAASRWLRSGSLTASVIPFIEWRILDGGRVQAEIHAAKVKQQLAALEYEKVVVNALADAERAMNQVLKTRAALAYQHSVVDQLRELLRSSQRRVESGAADPLELLDAQRQELEAQRALIVSAAAAKDACVEMFKVLGFRSQESGDRNQIK